MRYRSANSMFRQRFGCKVYKLSLSGGMTCPNRDGTKGDRGCIFCSASGSGDFAEPVCDSVFQQLERAKARVAFKAKNAKYIAYFQSNTNTYAPVHYLREIFFQAVSHPEVVALSVATRPDCLAEEVVALLSELNQIKPVMVELGLQTIHPATADLIRRGYDLAVYDDALCRLKAAGLEVIVHMILGLPGETPEMMLDTAKYIGYSGADGIKLQLLHVLEGTDLAKLWRQGRVPIMTLEAYLEVLGCCIEVLPEYMVVHRLTGDGAKRDLLAPLWSADKKAVLNALNAYFELHDIQQGRMKGKGERNNVF